MGEVVSLQSKQTMVPFRGTYIVPPKTREDYLNLCKQHLLEEDYHDILLGIMDYEIYLMLESQIKKIVDCYFDTFKE